MKKNCLLFIGLTMLSTLVGCGKNKNLEDCSWKEIKAISDSGRASKRFKIGDTKTLRINDFEHMIRIIGFNHDLIAGEERKAGITFEFANVITVLDSEGKPNPFFADLGDYALDFPNSPINVALQSEMYDMLPSDLRSVIKTVTKDITLGETYSHATYDTKLFPLSYTEVGKENTDVFRVEGSAYEYYQTFDNVKLIRKIASDAERGCQYWLRSLSMYVSPYGSNNFGVVDESGYPYSAHILYDLALAPAFCI